MGILPDTAERRTQSRGLFTETTIVLDTLVHPEVPGLKSGVSRFRSQPVECSESEKRVIGVHT